MVGQWIGRYTGYYVEGEITVNIEKKNSLYLVITYMKPDNVKIPSSVAYAAVEQNKINEEFHVVVNAVDPRNGSEVKWEKIKNLYDLTRVSFTEEAFVKVNVYEKDKLVISGRTDELGNFFSSELIKSSEVNSTIDSEKMSWNEFKNYIQKMSKSDYLFRGQQNPWKLRTSFHRQHRFYIRGYIDNDIKELHRKLTSITSHYFDFSIAEQFGAFLNLLQHHGYPTPLLDWSYSPYVATFFAFKDLPKDIDSEECARIYIFDNAEWQSRYSQIQELAPCFPHLSVMEFIAIDNPRAIPQQAITTVTNIDDIEDYINKREIESKTSFLKAIDISKRYRDEIMKDLKFMGITSGSLFPSIDGICEELKEKNFD